MGNFMHDMDCDGDRDSYESDLDEDNRDSHNMSSNNYRYGATSYRLSGYFDDTGDEIEPSEQEVEK